MSKALISPWMNASTMSPGTTMLLCRQKKTPARPTQNDCVIASVCVMTMGFPAIQPIHPNPGEQAEKRDERNLSREGGKAQDFPLLVME